VVHQLHVGAVLAQPERHPQRIQNERVTHVRSELPADDHPAEDVDHEAEVQDALPAAQVREVADPQGIRPIRGEVPLHEIR
jgi:hypothetical protein